MLEENPDYNRIKKWLDLLKNVKESIINSNNKTKEEIETLLSEIKKAEEDLEKCLKLPLD